MKIHILVLLLIVSMPLTAHAVAHVSATPCAFCPPTGLTTINDATGGQVMNMVDIIEKDQYVYECDECKHAFKASEIKLVDPPKDISDVAPERGVMIICVDKDGVIDGKHNPTKEAGDKLIACPKCGKPHPDGFNLRGLRR